MTIAPAAVARAEVTPAPSTEEEIWRYSRIGDLALDRFTPVIVPSEPPAVAGGPADGVEPAATATVVDGHVVAVEVGDAAASAGVEVAPLGGVDGGQQVLERAHEPDDLFDHLSDVWGPEPLVIRVPAGVALAAPILVDHHVVTGEGASFPRLVVEAGQDADVTVVEVHRSAPVDALVVPVAEYRVGRAARLRTVVVQDLARTVWQVARQVSTVEQEGHFTSSAVVLGGGYARLRTDCRLVGRGAEGTLLAAYLGDGDQMLDFRTFQEHAAPDTTSELLFKGALGGRGRSVYTGLIRVLPGARGTNVFQTNRNLKVSDDAWAESVPNLEIENNEVQCSHASTVGPVDPEQRFYLESRGVPPDRAERLIVGGFFDEVVRRLGVAPIEAWTDDRLRADLERELA